MVHGFVILLVMASIVGGVGQSAREVERGKPFDLKAKEAVRIAGDSLEVRFERVTADSRCPVGVQCMWAGDAAVELLLEKPPAAAETRVLHTSGRFQQETEYEGLMIRLVDVKPQPKEGATIAPDDYRVTLVVRRK